MMTKRILSSISHILVGFFIQLIFGLGFNDWLMGAVAVSVFYYSRERTQFQYILKRQRDDTTFSVWYRGWSPFEWGFYPFLDWLFPTASAFALWALIVYY